MRGARASMSGQARSRSIYPVGPGQEGRLLQIDRGGTFLGILSMRMSNGRGHEVFGKPKASNDPEERTEGLGSGGRIYHTSGNTSRNQQKPEGKPVCGV